MFEVPAAFTIFSPIISGATPKEWTCDEIRIPFEDICLCNGTLTSSKSSIVVEWNLVCEFAWVSDFSTSMHMLGMLFGNFATGLCADWYGRRWTLLGTIIFLLTGTLISGLSPNLYLYIVARFICGMGYSGYASLSMTYAMEFLTPKWRSVCVSFGPFGEGIMLLGVIGYYFQDSWRTIYLVTAIPYFAIFAIFPFLPESPRWLLKNGQIPEAVTVFRQIAKINRHEDWKLSEENFISESKNNSASPPAGSMSYVEFFKNAAMRRTTLCLVAVWCTWVIMYFGISFNFKNIGGDAYLNIVFLGLCDTLAYPIAYLIGLRLNRRNLVALFMSGSALFLISLAILTIFKDDFVIDISNITQSLLLLAKFCSAGSRSSIRLFTGESFPTPVRNMGYGIVGVAASCVGLLAPQLAYLGSTSPSLPLFIFAGCSLIGAGVSFLLRETKGQPLNEDVQENKAKANK
ncbi:solute carrier family 22 member 21 isoform X2 [Folsomia candida]|nr:solute carrier family 22 member 21 isoform X2 [Folsomia candida]